jgi:vacuolar-type H+-ATPase subunit E/Vma4
MTDIASPPRLVDARRTALEPVRVALLDDARAEADRLIADATRAADLIVGRAQLDADAAIEQARRRGAASAEARADQTLTHTRSTAHTEILRAEDDIRRGLHGAARAAVLDLRTDHRYPVLMSELELRARRQLGPDAMITPDPDGGGFVAQSGGRRVDYTLPALADRALDALADKVAALWR